MSQKEYFLPVDTKVEASLVRTGAVIAGLAVVAVFAFLFLNRSHVTSREYYRPDGYIYRVNDLIESGRLVYRSPDASSSENTWGQIEFLEQPGHLSPKKAGIQNIFYDESLRLRNDIEQFNESGEGVFRIQRRRNKETGELETQIRFDETSYNFLLPYPEQSPLDIKISSGGDELPTLAGDGIALGFTPLGKSANSPDPEVIVSLPLRKWFSPTSSNGGYYQALGYNFMGEESGAVINLRSTEKGTTLRAFNPERFHLFINGVSLQQPGEGRGLEFVKDRHRDLPVNTFRLEEGDRIRISDRTISDPDAEMIFRFGRFDGASVMQSWIENGKLVSQVDPKIAQALPFTQQLVNATNTYGSGKNLPPPKIELTVNQSLNSILQTKLEEFVRHFDANLSRTPHTEFEPACIAVVDAITGDVLAIPSYPSPADLDKLKQQFQTGRAPDHIGESKISRLKWNQNFPTIPIGSTTKPILATAIWDTHPQLQRLTIEEPAGSVGSIFGLRLARPLATGSHARSVDPVAFLGKSSNTYTVSLYLLTLADPESFSVTRDGRVSAAQGRVNFSHHIRGDLIPNGLFSDNLPAHEKLVECFDIDLTTDYVFGVGSRIDGSFIAPLLRQLDIEEDAPVPEEFWTVTPARTVLNLQEIDTVRGELVSMLIGGNTNRWSNLKLAETYARIGSGKKVKARLVRDEKSDDSPSFDQMPDQKVLELVHQGMAASWQSGTSRRIFNAVDRELKALSSKGLDFKFFAKTGTARRTKYECAAVAFYTEIRKGRGKPLSALSATIYLQDRAASRGSAQNSAVAVELAGKILPDLVDWMKQTPAVQEALK